MFTLLSVMKRSHSDVSLTPESPGVILAAIMNDILKLRWKCQGNSPVTWPTEMSSHKSANCRVQGVREFCVMNFQSQSLHSEVLWWRGSGQGDEEVNCGSVNTYFLYCWTFLLNYPHNCSKIKAIFSSSSYNLFIGRISRISHSCSSTYFNHRDRDTSSPQTVHAS